MYIYVRHTPSISHKTHTQISHPAIYALYEQMRRISPIYITPTSSVLCSCCADLTSMDQRNRQKKVPYTHHSTPTNRQDAKATKNFRSTKTGHLHNDTATTPSSSPSGMSPVTTDIHPTAFLIARRGLDTMTILVVPDSRLGLPRSPPSPP